MPDPTSCPLPRFTAQLALHAFPRLRTVYAQTPGPIQLLHRALAALLLQMMVFAAQWLLGRPTTFDPFVVLSYGRNTCSRRAVAASLQRLMATVLRRIFSALFRCGFLERHPRVSDEIIVAFSHCSCSLKSAFCVDYLPYFPILAIVAIVVLRRNLPDWGSGCFVM